MPDRRLFVRPYRGFAACIPRFRSFYTVFSILLYRGFYPCIPWFLHASSPAFAKDRPMTSSNPAHNGNSKPKSLDVASRFGVLLDTMVSACPPSRCLPPVHPDGRHAVTGMSFQPPKACRTVPQWRRKSAISHLSGHFRIKRKPPPKTPAIKPRKPSYKIAKALI